MGEFRARLAEMADRVLSGEEIIVTRGSTPVARFVPVEPLRRRRPNVLREMLSERELGAFIAAMEEPLSGPDQRILEGEGTDDTGLWTGLPEDLPESRADSGPTPSDAAGESR